MRCRHPFAWPFAAVIVALAALSPQARAQGYDPDEITAPPPPLPTYDQPPPPGPDSVWTPGYWAWDDDISDYYWVQGAWVYAPRPGYLWTPGYWAWNNGYYAFHNGYWGPHVGYYGGVDYGYGYTGYGFEGGYWSGPHFIYNRAVNNVGRLGGAAVYNKPVGPSPGGGGRASFSGGPGGIRANPTPQQLSAAQESHIPATLSQMQRLQAAQAHPGGFAGAHAPGAGAPGAPRPYTPGAGGFAGGGSRYGIPAGVAGAPATAYRSSPTEPGPRTASPSAAFGQPQPYRGYTPGIVGAGGAPDAGARTPSSPAAFGQAPAYRGYSPGIAGGGPPHGAAASPPVAYHAPSDPSGRLSPPAAAFGQAISPAARQAAAAQVGRAPPSAPRTTPPPKGSDTHHGPQP